MSDTEHQIADIQKRFDEWIRTPVDWDYDNLMAKLSNIWGRPESERRWREERSKEAAKAMAQMPAIEKASRALRMDTGERSKPE